MSDPKSKSISSPKISAANIVIGKKPEPNSSDASLSGVENTRPISGDTNSSNAGVSAKQEKAINLDMQLLKMMWSSEDRQHFIGILSRGKGFHNESVSSIDEARKYILQPAHSMKEIYFACAEYKTRESRKAENAAGARAFWLDIDCGIDKASTGKGYADKEEAVGKLKEFFNECGFDEPSFIVDSGNGLHVYWCFAEFLPKDQWKVYAGKLKELTKRLNFLADDSRTSDIASVLRIPGTQNHKSNPPKSVTMLPCSGVTVPMEKMLAAIDEVHAKHCVEPLPSPKAPTQTLNTNVEIHVDLELLARVKSALSALTPDCDEKTWKLYRLAPLAALARNTPEFKNELRLMALKWSRGDYWTAPSLKWATPSESNGLTGEKAFDKNWNRFVTEVYSGRQTSIASIFKDAINEGWSDPKKNKTDDEFSVIDQKALEDIQSDFALMNLGNKISIVDMKAHEERVDKNSAGKLDILNRSDGALLIKRKIVANFPNSEFKNVTSKFFIDPKTTIYCGVEFHPSETTPNYLNLWHGPTVKPANGSWETIKGFLLTVICNGDQAARDYLVCYLAHALQMPEDKPGVSIVMLGGQGTGKGTLGRILQKIWSSTYLQVSNMNSVTGNFNAILECAFIVFLDEALFVGDRRSSDALKSLTTEPYILINEKHQPSRQINSLHRLFAATNADHWKHTDKDDRRDFVLRVSEERKGDHSYWHELYQAIEGGEVEALVHDLLKHDLSAFNVRNKPETVELRTQKIQSLGMLEEWWHDRLLAGCFCENDGEWPKYISTQNAVDDIKNQASRSSYNRITPRIFIDKIKLMCPSSDKVQRKINGTRQRGLDLPPLDKSRTEFEKWFGSPIDWTE